LCAAKKLNVSIAEKAGENGVFLTTDGTDNSDNLNYYGISELCFLPISAIIEIRGQSFTDLDETNYGKTTRL
jgi:hypothetical protein